MYRWDSGKCAFIMYVGSEAGLSECYEVGRVTLNSGSSNFFAVCCTKDLELLGTQGVGLPCSK